SRFASTMEPLQSKTRQTFVRSAADAAARSARASSSKRQVRSDETSGRTAFGSTFARSSIAAGEGIPPRAERGPAARAVRSRRHLLGSDPDADRRRPLAERCGIPAVDAPADDREDAEIIGVVDVAREARPHPEDPVVDDVPARPPPEARVHQVKAG